MTSNFTAFLRPFRAACLFVLLTVYCGGCSDSGSVDETPPADQLALSPSSLVFDEQDPAKNEFTVTATDGLTWVLQVKPSAAGCKFSASSGRGSGSFRVEQMPDDSSIEIEAIHAYNNGTQLKSNSVRITRGKAVLEPTLELAPEKLTFDPDDASANTVQVRSNTVWSAVANDEELVFSPASGENDGVITVTAAPAGKTSVITVTAGEGEQTVTQQVEITCENEIPVPQETIYYDDFDQTPFSGWADASAAWQNPTGPGAAGVTYTSARTRINNDNFGSSGRYSGASGANYVRIWFDNGPYFIVNDIALTPDQVDLTLSLGASFTAADCLIELSGDGSYWQRIDYTGSSAYNIWERISVDFTLAVPVQRLFIRFTPQGSQSYGVNFDDLKLTTGPGGQTVDLDGGDYRFPELPSNWIAPTSSQAVVSGDYAFFTHWTQTVNTRKNLRNYSYCYDTRRHNPIWVAYPMHACYREGGFGRTDPDPWTADPSLDVAYQSKIYRKDGPSGSDPYQYWTSNTMAYLQRSGYWGKGHLCMSSERGGANQQINMQTFYPTNIAPQPSAKAGTFGTVWGYVEALFAGTRNSENDIVADDGVQNMNIVSDTLFVVAGCYYEHDYWQEYDSSDSNQAEPDPAQKLCTMPTHQFKMALRTKSGSTGKRIQQCTADELQAVGFWIETFTDSPETSARAELRRIAVPVSFIEEKMGMTFFPEVPEEVKTRIPVPEEWGF